MCALKEDIDLWNWTIEKVYGAKSHLLVRRGRRHYAFHWVDHTNFVSKRSPQNFWGRKGGPKIFWDFFFCISTPHPRLTRVCERSLIVESYLKGYPLWMRYLILPEISGWVILVPHQPEASSTIKPVLRCTYPISQNDHLSKFDMNCNPPQTLQRIFILNLPIINTSQSC